MPDPEPRVEYGYERDTLTPGRDPIRWWIYLHGYGRPQAPRKGVRDDGFRFARGGRAATAEEAEQLLAAARSRTPAATTSAGSDSRRTCSDREAA